MQIEAYQMIVNDGFTDCAPDINYLKEEGKDHIVKCLNGNGSYKINKIIKFGNDIYHLNFRDKGEVYQETLKAG